MKPIAMKDLTAAQRRTWKTLGAVATITGLRLTTWDARTGYPTVEGCRAGVAFEYVLTKEGYLNDRG